MDVAGNGKITLAVLGEKMDTVIKQQDAILAGQQADHDAIIRLEEGHTSLFRRMGVAEERIEVVNRSRRLESRMSSLIAVAVGAAIWAWTNP